MDGAYESTISAAEQKENLFLLIIFANIMKYLLH